MATGIVLEMELVPNDPAFANEDEAAAYVRETLDDLSFYNVMGPDGSFITDNEGATVYSCVVDCMTDLYVDSMGDHNKIVNRLSNCLDDRAGMTMKIEPFGMWIDSTRYDFYGYAPVED